MITGSARCGAIHLPFRTEHRAAELCSVPFAVKQSGG
jgi:hypothetical protein